jgi:hypothetical protein
MSKTLLVLAVLLASQLGLPGRGQAMLCMGAVHAAAAQERSTPPGEWCQRPPVRSTKAHACACHQHDCTDPDPNHVSAHVDAACLNFCTVSQCQCAHMDCP